MSLGGYTPLQPNRGYRSFFSNFENAGIILLIAAGNGKEESGYVGLNMSTPDNASYPASYPNKNIIAVVSLSKDGNTLKKAPSSNFGGYSDIAAPGDSIYTFKKDGISYDYKYGTSFAAPYITGVLAAGKAVGPDITPQQLVRMLYWSATRNPDFDDIVRNGKIVNVGSFISTVKTCQNDSQKCADKFDKYTFPKRYDMSSNDLPDFDPDKHPTNYFLPYDAYVYISGEHSIKLYFRESNKIADSISIKWRPINGNWDEIIIPAPDIEKELTGLEIGSYEFQFRTIKNGVYSATVNRVVTLPVPQPTTVPYYGGIIPAGYSKLLYDLTAPTGEAYLYINNDLVQYVLYNSISGSYDIQPGQSASCYSFNHFEESGNTTWCNMELTGWYNPRNLQVQSVGIRTIQMSWDHHFSGTPDVYIVKWRQNKFSSADSGEITLMPNTTNHHISTLYDGDYWVELRAIKSGAYSDIFQKMVTVGFPPITYSVGGVSGLSSHSFTVPNGYGTATYNINLSGGEASIYKNSILIADGYSGSNGTFPVQPGDTIFLQAFGDDNYMTYAICSVTLIQ